MGIDTQPLTPTTHPSTHWYVPLNELDAEQGAPLRPADLKPSTAEPLAKDGDSFLVTLESLLIVEKHDRESDNDLLVRSRLKYGNDPVVEAINFFENDVPPGVVRNNLLCEYIYAQDQYVKLDRVHLDVEVMELPRDTSLDKKIVKGLNVIKNTFGVVFSSFLPYSGIAFEVMEKVNNIRSKRRRIFSSQLDLYGAGGEGEARLCYGAYVFFKEPVDASLYKLHRLQMIPKMPEHQAKPFPHDYIVVKIVPTPIRVGSSEELALNNQKLAIALGTLDGQMDNNVEWHPNFERIITDGEILRKLALLYSLKKRKTINNLDPDQATLYQTLLQELQEFI